MAERYELMVLCSLCSLYISVKKSRILIRVIEKGSTFLAAHQLAHLLHADSEALVVLPLHDEHMRAPDCSETPSSERDFSRLAMQPGVDDSELSEGGFLPEGFPGDPDDSV